MRDFNDVLPSKWGHDEAIDELEATKDATPVVGEQTQIDHVAKRKEEGEKAYKRLEEALNLRVDGLRKTYLEDATRKLKTSLYDADFDTKAKSIIDNAWNVCLVDFKNL